MQQKEIRKEDKMQLSKQELFNIKGGAITATMINALSRAVAALWEIGRAVGSTLRRIFSKDFC